MSTTTSSEPSSRRDESQPSVATKGSNEGTDMRPDEGIEVILRQNAWSSKDAEVIASQVFWLLVAFRLLNASVVRTFFQPDEYFQSLEPAWQLAFGDNSGAWITWEWQNHLRSTLYPYIFAAVYWLSAHFADLVRLSASYRAELLIAAPKTLQACLAAVGDYYTWRLGQLVYGEETYGAWATLALTVINPFHFFVITRTLSNCLELVLTTVAIYLWFTSAPADPEDEEDDDPPGKAEDENEVFMSASWISTKLENSTIKLRKVVLRQVSAYNLNRLRLCLILAAVACVLRITNILTWIVLVHFEFIEYDTQWYQLLCVQKLGTPVRIPRIRPNMRELNSAHGVLIREAVICGSVVLSVSLLLDRAYYGEWVLPAVQFLRFNIGEGIADFYGVNDSSWYFTQGFPLLLGAFAPFAYIQIHWYLVRAPAEADDFQSIIKYEFAAICVVVPLVFSIVSHKEVRFIYPLLPLLHGLAAGPAAEFFRPILKHPPFTRHDRQSTLRYSLAAGVLFTNLLAAIIVTQYHQRAPLDVISFLRYEHEEHYLPQPPAATGLPPADTTMTVGFLMPCHSTPWRSHLVHPGIKAWALGCEPPIGMSAMQKKAYRDEADRFYDEPEKFLATTLGKPKSARKSGFSTNQGFGLHGEDGNDIAWDGTPGKKVWPEYLVFFAEKEELLAKVLRDTAYVQCWRGWNAWFHDDWRRTGDVVVWCLRNKPLNLNSGDGIMVQKLLKKRRNGVPN